jgi:two-component system sensor histidine kinase/response regulator
VGKPTLLVVDDEEGPRASLKVVFKNDFEVLLAPNGRDGLKLAKENRVDVAILDILMPGLSGVDVLRELKLLDADMEVIMLTAYETLDTARQALRLGACEYLNKPFDISTLRAAVLRALEKRRANRELKSAHNRLSDLQKELAADAASSVVHDLNNPLTVINGFVELIYRQIQNSPTLQGEELEAMRGSIARVHAQVQRCLEISRRYLSHRRSEDMHAERTSINEVLVDLQELLAKHPHAAGHTLLIRELDEPTVVCMHGTDLLRILLNLVTNALQSTDRPHRVEIVAQKLPAGFDISSFRDGPNERFIGGERLAGCGALVAVSVQDNGAGIPPEIVARLFDEQVTTKTTGHGLGLGSVKGLVAQALGAVRLTTKSGQGSAFTIFLPAKE